eukprot:12905190-Prorocentrum_lima.AAC.1
MSKALVSAQTARGRVATSSARRARAGVETNPMSSTMKGTMSLPYWRFLSVAACLAARPGYR